MNNLIQPKLLRDIIKLDKGKPPAQQGYYGPDAAFYLTPDYLRGGAQPEHVKPSSNAVHVQDGETIVLWDGSNAGEIFRSKQGVLASTMARVIHSEDYDSNYFFFALKGWEGYLKGQTSGSGIPHVDKEVLGKLTLFEFPKPEQSKIAEVLSKVEQAIEQTESLIAKQQRIKTGLMQDLLTRGIDEHGNLRSEETHEFKDSPMGRIPVEWEVKELGNICDVTSSKRIYFRDYKSDGIPFYRSKEIIELSTQGATQGELYIAYNKYEEIGKKFGVPSDGDILISSVGTLGICYLVKKTDRFYFKDGNLIWFRKFKCPINSLFLLNLLPKMIEIQFDNLVIGTSQKAFTIEKLKKMNLFFPKGEEQDRIAKAILHEQIANDLCVCQLSKLRSLKTALMQDLLTGKVRVTPLMENMEVCS